MKYLIFPKWLILFSLLAGPSILFSEVSLPSLASPVTDLAGVLSVEEKSDLDAKIRKLHEVSEIKASILVIPSLEGETIEQFSIRLLEKETLGKQDVDNGLLITLAMKERKVRIEVGLGLEGSMTDYVSHKIINNIFVPHFKQRNFHGGFVAGLNEIAKIHGSAGALGGGTNFKPIKIRRYKKRKKSPLITIMFIAFLVGSIVLSGIKSKPIKGIISSLIFCTVGFFVIGSAFGLLAYVGIAVVGFLFGIMGFNRGIYYSSGGGFRSGSSGGGFSSGGGGSWGGGGGGFSGGGASGDW
ncbi:MAG: hypothetical protein HOE90_08835 [Bacteriovoracaceae bacterium]|jgi:uncharacterized protein|nr:hypothetical protein [Bacteriovoracaceae bacterium]